MSIEEKLYYVKNGLRGLRKSIVARGGEVSLVAGLKDLPNAIYNIPAGASLAYQKDESVAYRKIAPSGAEEYAKVAKVGGMSYKCNNLLKIVDSGESTLIGYSSIGVSIPALENEEEDFSYYDFSAMLDTSAWKPNTTYYFSHELQAAGNVYMDSIVLVLYKEGEWIDDIVNFEGDFITPENVQSYTVQLMGIVKHSSPYEEKAIINFMLNEGNTALPYEPYFDGLREAAVTELASEGVNLLNTMAETTSPSNTSSSNTTPRKFIPNTIIMGMASNNYYSPSKAAIIERTKDYITFTTSSGYGLSFALDLKPNTSYSVSYVCTEETTIPAVALYNEDETFDRTVHIAHTHNRFTTNGSGRTLIVFHDNRGNYGDVITTTVSNIMLNEGEAAASYKPYRGSIDTFPISAELRAFLADKGYGRGVEGYPNYIDFESKVFVQNTYHKVCTGAEDWRVSSTAQADKKRIRLVLIDETDENGNSLIPLKPSANNIIGAVMCNFYQSITAGETWNVSAQGIAVNDDNALTFYDENYNTSDISLWKARLAELYASGNPLIVEYALAEPIETDISAYLNSDNFIQVEGDGVITFKNTYEYAAPSTIEYIFKTEGA